MGIPEHAGRGWAGTGSGESKGNFVYVTIFLRPRLLNQIKEEKKQKRAPNMGEGCFFKRKKGKHDQIKPEVSQATRWKVQCCRLRSDNLFSLKGTGQGERREKQPQREN